MLNTDQMLKESSNTFADVGMQTHPSASLNNFGNCRYSVILCKYSEDTKCREVQNSVLLRTLGFRFFKRKFLDVLLNNTWKHEGNHP